MLLVGDGALHPDLALALSRALRVRVHRGAVPRAAALTGAGLAAMAALRHPAAVWTPAHPDAGTPGGHR